MNTCCCSLPALRGPEVCSYCSSNKNHDQFVISDEDLRITVTEEWLHRADQEVARIIQNTVYPEDKCTCPDYCEVCGPLFIEETQIISQETFNKLAKDPSIQAYCKNLNCVNKNKCKRYYEHYEFSLGRYNSFQVFSVNKRTGECKEFKEIGG